MEMTIEFIGEFLRKRDIPLFGVASAEELDNAAPAGFRPSDVLAGAKSVIIFAKPLPRAVFLTPDAVHNKFYIRSYATYYTMMDAAANEAALMLESRGHLSLPIPAYSPLRFHDGDPRGLISLKHAAAAAGLGVLGRSSLLIHPVYGNTLRLGGLITTMSLAANTSTRRSALPMTPCSTRLPSTRIDTCRPSDWKARWM